MIRSFYTPAAPGALALVLSGCAATAILEGHAEGEDAPVIAGSRGYYSNEALAETYSQTLGNVGYEADCQYRIGQREVYLSGPEVESVDITPEYTDSLLQYFTPDTEVTLPEDILVALIEALPESPDVLTPAEASDQDPYVVTAEFAKVHSLESVSDLAATAAEVEPLTPGGNSRLETRPYGPKGLEELYSVGVVFTLIGDSGGALSVKTLKNNQVQLIDAYSVDPVLAGPELQVLEDPKGMFLSPRVIPLVSERSDPGAVNVLNTVLAALGSVDLIEMNRRPTEEAAPPQVVIRERPILGGITTEY